MKNTITTPMVIIIHGDIKLDNMIGNIDNKNATIIDHGFSHMLQPGQTSYQDVTKGTHHYIAPEIYYDDISQYNTKTDVYAFGMCIVYTIDPGLYKNYGNALGGFLNMENLYLRVKEKPPHTLDLSKANINTALQDELRDLIKRATSWDPNERPEMAEIAVTLDRLSRNMSVDQWAVHNKQLTPSILGYEKLCSEAKLSDADSRLLLQIDRVEQNETTSANIRNYIKQQLTKLNTQLLIENTWEIDLTGALKTITQDIEKLEKFEKLEESEKLEKLEKLEAEVGGISRLCEEAMKDPRLCIQLMSIADDLAIAPNNRYDDIKLGVKHANNISPFIQENMSNERNELDKARTALGEVITATAESQQSIVTNRLTLFTDTTIKNNANLISLLSRLNPQQMDIAFTELYYIDTLLKGSERQDLKKALKDELDKLPESSNETISLLQSIVPNALNHCFEQYERQRQEGDNFNSIITKLGAKIDSKLGTHLCDAYSKTTKAKATTQVKSKLHDISKSVKKRQ